jgi:hypothetical protein
MPGLLRSLTVPLLLWALAGGNAFAQSTFGSILGNVRDPTGAVVPVAKITVLNEGTSTKRATITDESGSYSMLNLDAATYDVTVEAPGFQTGTYKVVLTAREVARVDARLSLASQTSAVNVVASVEAPISTEVSNIAETKTARELADLPVGLASKAAGSTSVISTLTTQVGVQTDSSGAISIAGSKPAMVSVSLDGISSTQPRSSGPITELFPSMYAIAEIRVSESNNSAEFSGASDITTISKSGTNTLHGGLFENLQNTALQARNTFSAIVPVLRLNNYGAYLGGPVRIPRLYNGRDKTFFFASYEGLRLPKQTVLVESVPSPGLRTGDLSSYLPSTFNAPGSGTPYPNNVIPMSQISPLSLNVIKYLFPLPNIVSSNINSNNYVQNFDTPITSDQGDVRLDQTITSRQSAYARFTYKKKDTTNAPSGSVLVGPVLSPELDSALTAAHTFIIRPTLINELRAGWAGSRNLTSIGLTAATIAGELGITGLPQELPTSNVAPTFSITGFQSTGQSTSRSLGATVQLLDSVTWTKQHHTIKFGGDYRRLTAYYSDSKLSSRLGSYTFSGAVTNLGSNGKSASASNPAYIGNIFGAFLLGIPDKTSISTVLQGDTNSIGHSEGLYVQDDWKVAKNLTLNLGLRWEFHPTYNDRLVNITNFLPDYNSTINGQVVHGAVIIPNEALPILNPTFVASIAPTPILLARQVGEPDSLRTAPKTDFAPRFGFAWRPGTSNKTVIRGGYGLYYEGLLGGLTGAAWSIAACFLGNYNQAIVNNQATLVFPHPFPANIAQPGSENFTVAFDPNYKDPFVHEWNLTVERDVGFGVGLRGTYTGSHSSNLGISINYNQLPANTIGYAASIASIPFPLWSSLPADVNGARANYNSFTGSATKRYSRGLLFEASYVFSKNLSDGNGLSPTGFASESGGKVTDRFNPGLDYGNDAYTRRHRVLITFLYNLPFGKGNLVGHNTNRVLDGIIGDWQLSAVMVYQTGPFLTVTTANADPGGINYPLLYGASRPDIVSGAALYPAVQTTAQWVNSAAFTIPATAIGRFGNAPVGDIVGPGTQAVATSLIKSVKIREGIKFQIGAQVANLFNHPNYAPPNLSLATPQFGTITSLQSAEGAGPRSIQLTARVTF